jgi:hypothetical protein
MIWHDDGTVSWLPLIMLSENKIEECSELIAEFFVEPEIKTEEIPDIPDIETMPKIWKYGSAIVKTEKDQWKLENLYPKSINFGNLNCLDHNAFETEIVWKYSHASIIVTSESP